MIRSPGLAGDPPPWFGQDEDVPRAVHAGPWIAQHGQFFDGWGRRADHGELPGLAAAGTHRQLMRFPRLRRCKRRPAMCYEPAAMM